MTEGYVIPRSECRDNWQRSIFDSAFKQGKFSVGLQVLALHSMTDEVAEWNLDGERLCDACLVPFPCETAVLLNDLLS